VLGGASAANTVIGSGAVEVDYGFASGASAGSGGYDLVASGAGASTTVVNGGSEYVLAGGSAIGTTVSNGLEVAFGVITSVLIGSGASEFVSSGATASATTISGGTSYVIAGGTAIEPKLVAGAENVFGTAISAVIGGGTQVVETGGVASATVLSGGMEDISAGAVASGTTIRGTGYEFVFSGGTASGTILSGGTLEVASGGSTGVGAVTFSSGGTLRLDDSIHFGGLVASFSVLDVMDLADIPFVSGGSGATTFTWTQLTSGATASGSLLVAQGTQSATLTLLGQYTQPQFHILGDGAGGTLVTDPPVAIDPGPFALAATHQT
jgi:autotransporter passenger strand-loop-strand repeat protein